MRGRRYKAEVEHFEAKGIKAASRREECSALGAEVCLPLDGGVKLVAGVGAPRSLAPTAVGQHGKLDYFLCKDDAFWPV